MLIEDYSLPLLAGLVAFARFGLLSLGSSRHPDQPRPSCLLLCLWPRFLSHPAFLS